MKTIELKAQPTKLQAELIDAAIRVFQLIRNKCLKFWMDAPKEANIGRFQLKDFARDLKKLNYRVNNFTADTASFAADRAWSAIARFYKNCKTGKPGKKGYPRFQQDNRSFECRNFKLIEGGFTKTGRAKRGVHLPDFNIGVLKLFSKYNIWSVDKKFIKRARIIKRADGYYVQFVLDLPFLDIQPTTGEEIGLSLGQVMGTVYVDSRGDRAPTLDQTRIDRRIRLAERKIRRRKKLSANRKKARILFAKRHLKASRQRIELAKKLARCVCKSNDLIAYSVYSGSDKLVQLFQSFVRYFAVKFGRDAILVDAATTADVVLVKAKSHYLESTQK